MEDALAFHAAQRCARRLNTAREAVRLYGADHDRFPALLRTTCEDRCSALRGGRDAELLPGASSTQVPRDGIPLRKRPRKPQLCAAGPLLAQNKLPFQGKNPPSKPMTRRKIGRLWGIFLSARPPMSKHILDGYSTATCCRCPSRSGSAGRNFGVGGFPIFAVTFIAFCNIVTPSFSRHPEKQKRMDIRHCRTPAENRRPSLRQRVS